MYVQADLYESIYSKCLYYKYVSLHVYMYVYMYVCMYVFMNVCMYVCMYVCFYITIYWGMYFSTVCLHTDYWLYFVFNMY